MQDSARVGGSFTGRKLFHNRNAYRPNYLSVDERPRGSGKSTVPRSRESATARGICPINERYQITDRHVVDTSGPARDLCLIAQSCNKVPRCTACRCPIWPQSFILGHEPRPVRADSTRNLPEQRRRCTDL